MNFGPVDTHLRVSTIANGLTSVLVVHLLVLGRIDYIIHVATVVKV